MPPENGVTISPRPAHRMSFGASQTLKDPKGAFLLSFITLTIAVTAFFAQLDAQRPQGLMALEPEAVALRVRDGVEYLVSIDAVTGDVRVMKEIVDADAVLDDRFAVTLGSGTTVTTDASGVVALRGGTPETLIASAMKPRARSPIAVGNEGNLVAWVAPGDYSLQVFRRVSDRFVPIFLAPKSFVESLAFTEDGTHLLSTTSTEEGETEVWSTDLETQQTSLVFSTEDIIIFTNRYE